MDKLRAMATFVAINDGGSLSAAAEQLDRSPAAVVRTLAELEKQLGVRLLNRSTRRISLTDEGRDYLQQCRQILADVEAAEFQLEHRRHNPSGKINITAPVVFGRLHLAPVLYEWLANNPSMSAELTLLDRVVDVIEEGFDLALRIGEMADSSLVARAVGVTPHIVCASPLLFKEVSPPQHPQELSEYPIVHFSQNSETWRFQRDGNPLLQKVTPTVISNQIYTVLEAATAGLGIAKVLGYQAQSAIADKTLVPILTEFAPPPIPVQFVFPHNRLMSSRVRQFLDFAIPRLQSRLCHRVPTNYGPKV